MLIREVYTKEETRYLRIAFMVSLVIAIIAVLFVLNKRRIGHDEEGSYYALNARFNRTDGLLIGDMVRLAGMDIGKVVSAKLDDNYKAILTLEIKDGIQIPDDSSASIVSSGLMGAKYIEIEPGGSEDMLTPEAEFAYTQDAMVLEELLDRIVSMGKANRKPCDAK